MAKQQILLSSAIGLCFGAALLYAATPLAENIPADYGIAQGDGEPDENSLETTTPGDMEELSDGDEDVATITAEGDFLVPTYLLPVEEELKEEPVVQNNVADNVSVTKTITTTTTTTTTTEELPIFDVSSKSDKKPAETVKLSVPSVKSEAGAEEKTVSKQVSTAQQAPRYIGTGHAAPSKQSVQPTVVPTSDIPVIPVNLTPAPIVPKTPVVSVPEHPILVPLAPLPKVAEPEPIIETPTRKVIPSEYADRVLATFNQNERPDFIMPQEIKVSFYRNASEFSGQTIKWIKAFSVGALNDPRLIVQVRLSVYNPAVQQKRLSVVRNTLIGAGLSPHQIQVVFTNRPTDSLILRLMDKPEAVSVSIRQSKAGRRVEKRTTKW